MKLYILAGLALSTLAGAQEIRSGYFRGQAVHYKVVDGEAITEGDILLDPQSGKTTANEAIAINAARYRWTDGVVPYTVDATLPSPQRITDAIQHWTDNTGIKLVPRTNESNYIRFVRRTSGCSSFVGMIGGAQAVNLGPECAAGSIIHEIGHAVGLFHEQSRQDRDFYLQVNYENIDKLEFTQYDQQLAGADDVGGYDFGSIMHYSSGGFSRNGSPAMNSIPMGIPFGQRSVLSPGDLDAVKRMYGFANTDTTIATFPAGLRITVDGETYISPRTFQWPAGSTHALDVSATQAIGTSRAQFARWSDEGAKSHTITASAATSLYVANFSQYVFFAGIVSPAAGGTLQYNPPSDDGFYPFGAQIEITAVPSEGFSFGSWSGFGLFSIHGISPNPLRFTLDDSRTRYNASFTRLPVTSITSDPPGRQVSVDGRNVVAPENFTWTAGTTHTLGVPTDTQTSFTGSQRYVFQNWSDGGDGTHTVTATGAPATFTAGFKTQHLVSTAVVPTNLATLQLTPLSPDGYYDNDTELKILPLVSGISRFVNWSGDLGGSETPATLIVNDQKLVTANFASPRQIRGSGTVNAASFQQNDGVVPGEILTIFGLELGPESLVTSRINPGTQRLDTVLDGTRVSFDGIAAALIYVSPNQISTIVPYSVAGKTTTHIVVDRNGQSTNALIFPVVESAPALFTFDSSGRGPGALLNQNGSINTQSNPARRGSTVVLYGTGEGQTTPGGIDGKPAVAPLPKPVLPVKVLIASREAIVSYAGAAPGLTAGLLQVNVRIPDDCPVGAVPVSLIVGTKSSPANVTIWVQ